MRTKKSKKSKGEKSKDINPIKDKYENTFDTVIYRATPGFPRTLSELEEQNPEWYFQLRKEYPSTPRILRELVEERKREEKKRTGKRLTQEQIAEEIGVSKQTLCEWLQDRYEGKYREKNLILLADYFHVQVGYLKGEQIERIKDESTSPEKIKSRNLETYLKTLGFSFVHGYGMDPDDPLGEDPYYEYYHSEKDEIHIIEDMDENGNKSIKRYVESVPTYTYPFGKPLMITFPSGRKVLVRENTFDKYCEEFEEWIGFVLGKLLEHASNEDINMGTLPEGSEGEKVE